MGIYRYGSRRSGTFRHAPAAPAGKLRQKPSRKRARGHAAGNPGKGRLYRRCVFTAALLACLGVPAAPAGSTSADSGYAPPWAWPVDPVPRVLEAFRPPPHPWLSGHRGVDLAAAPDATVAAPAAGTVSFAGWVVDRPVLTVDHGNGLRSSFEPVAASLKKGAAVARGDPIGQLAGRGHCSGPCLHWGVRRDGQYVNPLQFVLDLRPSVLLPRPPDG